MNTSYTTYSAKETISLASAIGSRLRGGEIFVLNSDMGGGKTTFTKGLANGAGITDDVSSPSFTVQNSYTGSRLSMEHFDFYRLQVGGVVEQQLKEVADSHLAVIVIEWGDIVSDNIPEHSITCTILAKDDEVRVFEFTYGESYSYLFDGVMQ